MQNPTCAGLLAAVLSLTVGLPASAAPASGSQTYDVIRKGKDIGDQVIHFQSSGDTLTVTLVTDVSVKVLGIEAYGFHQKSVENWNSGHLATLASHTDDNGKTHDINVKGGGLIPASLWNEQVAQNGTLLNTIDGSKMKVSVKKVGTEAITAGGQQVPATHYRLSGDLERDLWYDADGRLVHVAMKGEDGSQVDYVLR